MCQDLLKKQKNKLKGQTLTEIVMAVVIFSMVAIGLAGPLTSSIITTDQNQDINTANNLARSYLKDLQDSWELQTNFDAGALIDIDETYTNNGKYNVDAQADDLQLNDDGNVIVRRVSLTYEDSNDNILCEIYLDYNRPGNI